MGNSLKNKGSKYWIQKCIKDPELKLLIDKRLKTELEWISPSDKDSNEHELRTMHKLFGLGVDEINEFFSFWPKRQPQWDGIAIDANNILYLFEAKAHPSELRSFCRASGQNRKMISDSMLQIHDEYYPQGDYSLWMNVYYQIGNRITFFHKLDRTRFPKIKKVVLVFLSFANDYTNKPTSILRMETSFNNAWEQLTGISKSESSIKHLLIDVKDI